MTSKLNAALTVIVASVALPGIASAQSSAPSSGYRWGAPVIIQDEEPAPPTRRPTQAAPETYGQSDGPVPRPPSAIGGQSAPMQSQMQSPMQPQAPSTGAPQSGAVAGLPPEDQPEVGEPKELPARFQRQLVDYPTREPAGTIVIDTPNTYLYLVLGDGKAMRYGIGVGREGFTWTGAERVSRMAEWPDWHPPTEMIERQPYLPRFMAGGEGNPLGARALYLGKTLYRIHGTNQPSTIGSFVSSGCIRLTNRDVEDLYSRVQVGTRVVVLPAGKPAETASAAPVPGSGPAGVAQGGPPVGVTPATPQGQPLPGYVPSVGAPGSPNPASGNASGGGSISASPLPPPR